MNQAPMNQPGPIRLKGGKHMPSTPEPQVWPTLRAHDARALIKFLVDAFGFEETVVYGDGDRVEHAQLSWPPGGGIMLGSVREGNGDDTDGHGQATPTRTSRPVSSVPCSADCTAPRR